MSSSIVRGSLYIALFTGLAADGVDPEHPAHERFLEQYDDVYNSLLRFFEWARSNGRLLPDVDPDTAARSVIALEDGAQVQWLYAPHRVDVPRIVQSYLKLVLSGA